MVSMRMQGLSFACFCFFLCELLRNSRGALNVPSDIPFHIGEFVALDGMYSKVFVSTDNEVSHITKGGILLSSNSGGDCNVLVKV
jgi:hypothetical protein